MDELKQSVQLAVHEQKDPLLIYKFEAFELFKSLMDKINRDIVSFCLKANCLLAKVNPYGKREMCVETKHSNLKRRGVE